MADAPIRDIYENILKRRAEIARQLEVLDEALNALRPLVPDNVATSEYDEQPELYVPESGRAAYSARINQMMDESRRIIIGKRRPMKRAELVERLEQLGYDLAGGDKRKVFGTNIWRSKQFVTIGSMGYWPIDVELPVHLRELPIRHPV